MCICLIKMSQLNSRGAQPAGPLLFWELTLSINKGQIRMLLLCYPKVIDPLLMPMI